MLMQVCGTKWRERTRSKENFFFKRGLVERVKGELEKCTEI